MNATILTIGDELLIGQVVDTNAAWLSERLFSLGVRVRKVATVGDEEQAIIAALAQEWPESDLMIITGGLGPTPDDRTREAVAQYFGRDLALVPALMKKFEEEFVRRGRPMPEGYSRLALIPRGFEPLHNPAGSAPGLLFEDAQDGLMVVVPGVPAEMQATFADSIAARIVRRHTGHGAVHRTLCTAGVPETVLATTLADLTGSHRIAFLPRPGQVRLRLTATGVHAKLDLTALEAEIRSRMGEAIYGVDDDTLEAALGKNLRARGITIAVAESCTGGRVLDLLTNVAGASDYVRGGVVAYANEVKRRVLGVQSTSLARHGAVSETVAEEMAQGVRQALCADVGLSVTGIAGPGGGTMEKPVGTVWIGYCDHSGSEARQFRLGRHRTYNKAASAVLALDVVRRKLRGMPMITPGSSPRSTARSSATEMQTNFVHSPSD